MRSEVISKRAEKIIAKQKRLEDVEKNVFEKGMFSAELAEEWGLIDGIKSREDFMHETLNPKRTIMVSVRNRDHTFSVF